MFDYSTSTSDIISPMESAAYFYVYEHWRPDTNACFYVGKGHGNRAWWMYDRNPHHRAIQSKLIALGLAIDVRIIIENLTEEIAFQIERDRISLYDFKRLSNMTLGGEGASGASPSAETRAKLSAASKGRKLSPEHVAKVSAAHKGKVPAPHVIEAARRWLTGRKRSREAVEKQMAKRRGIPISEAHKKAISDGQRGKILSEEHKAKLSLAWKNRSAVTEETKRKLSESAKRDWAKRKAIAA